MSMTMAVAGSGIAMPVSAAQSDVIDTSKTASLTIHKYDMTAAQKGGVDLGQFTSTGKQDQAAEEALKKYAIKGVEFSYLRVGDVEQQSEGGKVQMIYEVPEELQKILGLADSDAAKTEGGKDYFTSQSINDKLAKALEDNTVTKDKLEDYMGKSGTAMEQTNASGVATKDNLDLGLYLIVETKVPEDVTYTTNPWFVQLPMTDSEGNDWFYDVVCYPKNETGVATLDKRVRNNPDQDNVTTANQDALTDFTAAREEYTYQDSITASKGEKLDYQLVSKLPHITSSATYLTTYTFEDWMAAGMTYNKDVVIAFYENKDAADTTNIKNVEESGALAVWKSSDPDPKFKTSYEESDDASGGMKIEMTNDGLEEINKKYSDKYIVAYYTANVNTDDTVLLGDIGNGNHVSLTWKRTSADYYDVLQDECAVYSFGYNLTKKFSDGAGDATKVQFVIQNKTDNYYLVAKADSAGVYQVTGKSATEEGATQFHPGTGGKLIIKGVEADQYGVTETHSDAGYSLLKKEILVNIKSTKVNITPTKANITGIQSKSDLDSTANDGVVNGEELDNYVGGEVVKEASATVDEKSATMSACDFDGNLVDPDKESTKREEVTSSDNAFVDMEITNQKQFLLPMTGGKGSYMLIIAGIVLAGIGFFVIRKNKKE